jgi:RNA polymerase sigma-70 factor (ECF subfamily)
MKPIPGTLQEGGAAFQSTHWTLVLRARQSDPTETAGEALSDFCEAYWPPLYTFLRLRGHASPEAQDLVQGFFAHLLEQNTLSRADQKKGRLRTFLLGSLQNFLCNEYDRAHRLKRGGGHRIVSIDGRRQIKKKRQRNLEFPSRRCVLGFGVCVSVIAKR